MLKKKNFPAPGCASCPHHQVIGGITRYCNGFKRRKAKRFRNSDPKLKAPRWCSRRISPPACRVYGFKDEYSEYMEMFWRLEYEAGRSKALSPSSLHYRFRTEITLGKTAKQFYDAIQEDPLSNILPAEVEVHNGEVIEIDDGLQPYYFYALDSSTIIPLPYFQLTKGVEK